MSVITLDKLNKLDYWTKYDHLIYFVYENGKSYSLHVRKRLVSAFVDNFWHYFLSGKLPKVEAIQWLKDNNVSPIYIEEHNFN
jgi:hypothetical protein